MYTRHHQEKMKRYSKDDWDRKITRERELRRQKSTSRQFNEPLRIFVETKCNDIFQEYNELYNRMLEDESAKKDLTKTTVFKEWLNANGGTVQLSKGSRKKKLPISSATPESPHVVTGDQTSALSSQDHGRVQDEASEQDDESEQASTVLTQALRDILDQEVVDMSSADFNLNVEMVAEIFDELQEDRDLRDVLEGANEDEGIGLNYFDEVEMDSQPFNYTLEVETNDF